METTGVILLISMNILAYILMAIDKHRAQKGQGRIAEATFVYLSMFGGTIGILLAGLQFRHKTEKRGFQLKILLGTLVFLIIMYAIYFGK